MLLYLMRHGHALTGASSDSERPLSKQGRQESADVARFLLQKGIQVDVFYQSTKKRAQETALIMKDILNPRAVIETKDGLAPDDPVDYILDEIPCWNERTMVVSHMPFLPRLISKLVTGREDDKISLTTATVVILQRSDHKWNIKEIIYPENILPSP